MSEAIPATVPPVAPAPKSAYDLPPDIGFREAARRTLHAAFQKMMDNAAGTRSGLERREPTPEEVMALHDMRVGSRRLRAALSVYVRIFNKDDQRKLGSEIAAITDALSMVRDLDVQRETLAALIADLPPNEAYGIEKLRERLAKQRDKERVVLIRALKTLDKSKFEKRFARALERGTTGAIREGA